MEADTKVYLRKKFKTYYWVNQVAAPENVHRREFGVGTLEDKIKFRHKSFTSEKAFNQFLKTEAPYYISYSAAYYEFPEQSMDCKGWLGADLIFDLDKPIVLLNQRQMDEVTEEALKLTDFLYDDFGFHKKDVRVNFSGSKGYHIHVTSDEVKSLDADARRQIIDYISGEGLEIDNFLVAEEGVPGIVYRGNSAKQHSHRLVGPKGDSIGWGARIYQVAEEILGMGEKELLGIDGIGPKNAKKLFVEREKNLRQLRDGKWSAFWGNIGKHLRNEIKKRSISITDEDRQVTADVSRLIRVPDTIHGGSGLLARKVKSLQDFDPLVDAVAFGGDKVRVRMCSDVGAFDLMGAGWGPYSGAQVAEVPESVGIYLMLKGKADYAN